MAQVFTSVRSRHRALRTSSRRMPSTRAWIAELGRADDLRLDGDVVADDVEHALRGARSRGAAAPAGARRAAPRWSRSRVRAYRRDSRDVSGKRAMSARDQHVRRGRSAARQRSSAASDIGSAGARLTSRSRAGASQEIVSRVERGQHRRPAGSRTMRRGARAPGDRAWHRDPVAWRATSTGSTDEGHAALVGRIAARRLDRLRWEVRPEVSFAVVRRARIDRPRRVASRPSGIAAWSSRSRSRSTSDRGDAPAPRRRRSPAAGSRRSASAGRASADARLLVLPDSSTPRRRVERHEAVPADAPIHCEARELARVAPCADRIDRWAAFPPLDEPSRRRVPVSRGGSVA